MIAEVFLSCALTIPPVAAFHGPWDFGKEEVAVIRMMRDYQDGKTASRPSRYVLIYGFHPSWVLALRQAGIHAVMLWNRERGPYKMREDAKAFVPIMMPNNVGVYGDPRNIPFGHDFQVYIFDDWANAYPPTKKVIEEASRVVSYWGFFLFNADSSPEFEPYLIKRYWQRFSFDFHQFQVWWRNPDLRDESLGHEGILKSMLYGLKDKFGRRSNGPKPGPKGSA